MNKGPENKPLLWLILLMIIVHSFHYEFYAAKIAFKIQRKEYSCQKIEPFFSFTENNDLFNPSSEILNICKNKIKVESKLLKDIKIGWTGQPLILPNCVILYAKMSFEEYINTPEGKEKNNKNLYTDKISPFHSFSNENEYNG